MIDILLFPALLVAASSGATSQALQITPCDTGDRYLYAQVECQVQVFNSGDKPVRLSDIKALRPSDSVSVSTLVVAPKSSAYIPVKATLDTGVGYVNHYFLLTSDEPGNPQYQFKAKAFVNSVLDDAIPSLNFGVVDVDKKLPVKSVTIASQEVVDLRIKRIVSAPDFLDVSIQPDGVTIAVTPKTNIAWGLHADEIRLEINAPQQPQMRIVANMDVHGVVAPAENPVDLGLMRQGQRNEALIRLTSSDHKPFKLGPLRTELLDGSVTQQPCIPDQAGCVLLKLSINATQPLGEVKGKVLVDLPAYGKTLPILVWGMLVRPETKVHKIGEDEKSDGTDKGLLDQAQSSVAVRQPSIENAIKQAVTKTPEPAPPSGTGPLLKWSASNESGIHGYIVYRSNSETGPFLRVSAESIPAQNVEGGSSFYQWRDTSAESGKTYWYYVGLVRNNGSKQQLSGPQRVVAK